MASFDVGTMQSNVERYLASATRREYFDGLTWYPVSGEECDKLAVEFGISRYKAHGIVGALSPQTRWTENIPLAASCIRAYQDGRTLRGHTTNAIAKVQKILDLPNSASLMDVLTIVFGKTGHKTVNFTANLLAETGDTSIIPTLTGTTLDRFAIGVAHGTYYGEKVPGLTPKQYVAMSAAYQAVADAHGLRVEEVQAITWLVFRRIHNVKD